MSETTPLSGPQTESTLARLALSLVAEVGRRQIVTPVWCLAGGKA